jgi:hypothetical protein
MILGVLAIVYGVFGFERETAKINLGGIQATATEKKTNPMAAVVGVVLVLGGIAVLGMPKRG